MTTLPEMYEWLYGLLDRTTGEPRRAGLANHRGKLIAEVFQVGDAEHLAEYFVGPLQFLRLRAVVPGGQVARWFSPHVYYVIPTVCDTIVAAQKHVEHALDNAEILDLTRQVRDSLREEK